MIKLSELAFCSLGIVSQGLTNDLSLYRAARMIVLLSEADIVCSPRNVRKGPEAAIEFSPLGPTVRLDQSAPR